MRGRTGHLALRIHHEDSDGREDTQGRITIRQTLVPRLAFRQCPSTLLDWIVHQPPDREEEDGGLTSTFELVSQTSNLEMNSDPREQLPRLERLAQVI
jgi:hypothetical protein